MEGPHVDPPEPSEPDFGLSDLPERILDFVNSQCHNCGDLDLALQAYQAYQVPSSQDSTLSPQRSINQHYTYCIAQASQAMHGSLVDGEADGGLAGSEVRI